MYGIFNAYKQISKNKYQNSMTNYWNSQNVWNFQCISLDSCKLFVKKLKIDEIFLKKSKSRKKIKKCMEISMQICMKNRNLIVFGESYAHKIPYILCTNEIFIENSVCIEKCILFETELNPCDLESLIACDLLL